MKKLILLLLFIPLVSFGQSEFSNGYIAGFKKGYCGESYGCISPELTFYNAPQPNLGFNSYSDGYSQGIIAGKKLQAKENPTTTQRKRKSGQNALISGAGDLGRSMIPTYTPNTNTYSSSTSSSTTRKSSSSQNRQTQSTKKESLQSARITNLVDTAVKENKAGNYSLAGKQLFSAYELSGEPNYLYYSASSFVNAKEYSIALEYYKLLLRNGYEADSEYFVTSVETGIEEKVTETEYNLFKSSNDYTNARIGKTESRLPEIYRNIALLYAEITGDLEKAYLYIGTSIDLFPNDIENIKLANKIIELRNQKK